MILNYGKDLGKKKQGDRVVVWAELWVLYLVSVWVGDIWTEIV